MSGFRIPVKDTELAELTAIETRAQHIHAMADLLTEHSEPELDIAGGNHVWRCQADNCEPFDCECFEDFDNCGADDDLVRDWHQANVLSAWLLGGDVE